MRHLRPEHPRNLFSAELIALKATQAERATLAKGHPIEAEAKRVLYTSARSMGYSVVTCSEAMIGDYGWKYSKLLGPPKGSPNLFEDQMRPFRERVAALQEGFKLREQGHKAELSRLAALTDPWPGKERLMFAEEWCSSYRSTNSGDRYAKVRAEIQAEELTSYLGLKAEVEAVRRASNLPAAGEWVPLPVDAYRVFVMVHSALDLELAKRSPRGMPFAEVVRLAWAKGANPRVYWPMLPHGYEEKNGFDHFGRKLVKGG